jgi:hypothetical protein
MRASDRLDPASKIVMIQVEMIGRYKDRAKRRCIWILIHGQGGVLSTK